MPYLHAQYGIARVHAGVLAEGVSQHLLYEAGCLLRLKYAAPPPPPPPARFLTTAPPPTCSPSFRILPSSCRPPISLLHCGMVYIS